MRNSIVVVSILLLSVLCAETALLEDDVTEHLKPYYSSVMHRFYGPWSTLHKRNGDYVDYNDYGGHIPDFFPSSPDLSGDSSPVYEGNLDEVPVNYGDRLMALNSDYKWKPVRLVDFRTGIEPVETPTGIKMIQDSTGDTRTINSFRSYSKRD